MNVLKLLLFFFLISLTWTSFGDSDNPAIFEPVPGTCYPPVRFGEIIYGKNSQYHEQPAGSFRQDLSGTATDGHTIIFIDDGGSPSEFNYVRVMQELPDNNAVNLPLTLNHLDLEGATFHKGYFVITASLSKADNADNRRLSRFKIKRYDGKVRLIKESSVDLRDQLMAALQVEFGDEWFNRIKDMPEKSGGLNIEGVSASHNNRDFLLWGLRSPLYGYNFPYDLKDGAAIIAVVHNPFKKKPYFEFITIDLNTEYGDHHGIRGIEWIPALRGYVIIGGPVPKDSGYSLWRLCPGGKLEKFYLPGFDQLCRPESVIQIKEGQKDYLVVLSEESGTECDNAGFTFIKAEIINGFRK
ncbi:MAG: hypothetical protein JXB88_18445 [Spirochaetales bacterium]|nr:hypothetical protein [Spirochaetales bacterium]